jgi:hypothetical protein
MINITTRPFFYMTFNEGGEYIIPRTTPTEGRGQKNFPGTMEGVGGGPIKKFFWIYSLANLNILPSESA